MPVRQPITLHSDSAESVAVEFTPVETSPQRMVLINHEGAISASNKKLIINFSRELPNRPTNRISQSLIVPLERTDDDVVTASDAAQVNFSYVLPNTMTSVERDQLANMASSIVKNAILSGYVKDLEPMY